MNFFSRKPPLWVELLILIALPCFGYAYCVLVWNSPAEGLQMAAVYGVIAVLGFIARRFTKE